MKNLFAKTAKEYKKIMKHIIEQSAFKNQKPQDIKDVEAVRRLPARRIK